MGIQVLVRDWTLLEDEQFAQAGHEGDLGPLARREKPRSWSTNR